MSAHNILRKLKILETIPKSENNMNFYLIFVYYSTSMEIWKNCQCFVFTNFIIPCLIGDILEHFFPVFRNWYGFTLVGY